MSFFDRYRNNNRPDIPKDAPEKKGAAKVLSTLWREFWGLIKLNFLFMLTCIPIVTIPASITAMSRITCTMAKNENYFLWADYKKAFKRDFFKSLLGGLIILLLSAIFIFSTYVYMLMYGNSKLFILLAGIAVCFGILVLFSSFYFFPMLAMVELPMKGLLVNSLLLALSNIKRTLLALVAFLIFLVGASLLFPYSCIYMVFIMFSMTSLMIALAVFPVIDKKTVKRTPEELAAMQRREEGLEDEEPEPVQQFVWDDEESNSDGTDAAENSSSESGGEA